MTDIPLTVIGNVTKTPVIQYLQGNKAILRLTVASTPRYYSKADQAYVDGETTFMPVEVRSTGSEKHNNYVEQLTEQFQGGDRVIVVGNLLTRSKTEGDDIRRWNVLIAEEIGFSTKFTKVTPQRKAEEPVARPRLSRPEFSHQEPALASRPPLAATGESY